MLYYIYKQEKVVVMALLNVQNLSIRFRSGGRMLPVVDRISFEVSRGEILAPPPTVSNLRRGKGNGSTFSGFPRGGSGRSAAAESPIFFRNPRCR